MNPNKIATRLVVLAVFAVLSTAFPRIFDHLRQIKPSNTLNNYSHSHGRKASAQSRIVITNGFLDGMGI